MANTNIRTLKIFEFNRALSYVSEIIEIERKIRKMQEEIEILKVEMKDWQNEEIEVKKDIEDVRQLVKNIVERIDEIKSEENDLQQYLKELKYLLSKIIQYVTEDDSKDLKLTKGEIQKSFIEEYIYLLSGPVLEDNVINIETLFKDKADLAMSVFESYGAEKEKIFKDIVNTESDDYLPQRFEDYFPQ